MQASGLERLKPNERRAVEAFVEALRREVDGQLLLLALFGSKARGDDEPDSDIDFLLVTAADPREVSDRVVSLESDLRLEYAADLNTLVFSRERWADFARRRAAFWQNYRRDGILLLRSPALPDALAAPAPEEDSHMPDHRPDVAGYMKNAGEALTAAAENIRLGHNHVVANRAYYAIFYAANAVLATLGLQRSKHSGVRAVFGEKFIKTGEIEAAYGKDYDEVMRRRQVSDYDWTEEISEDYVRVSLELAQRLVSRIEEYLKERGYLDNVTFGVTAQAAVLGGSFPAPGTARRAWMPEQLPFGS